MNQNDANELIDEEDDNDMVYDVEGQEQSLLCHNSSHRAPRPMFGSDALLLNGHILSLGSLLRSEGVERCAMTPWSFAQQDPCRDPCQFDQSHLHNAHPERMMLLQEANRDNFEPCFEFEAFGSSDCGVGSETESANLSRSLTSNTGMYADDGVASMSYSVTGNCNTTLPVACLLCIEHYFEPQGAFAPEECLFCHLNPHYNDLLTVPNNQNNRVHVTEARPPTLQDNKFVAYGRVQPYRGEGFYQQSDLSVSADRLYPVPGSTQYSLSECGSPVMQPSSTPNLARSDDDLTQIKTMYTNNSEEGFARPVSAHWDDLPMVHYSVRRYRHSSAELPDPPARIVHTLDDNQNSLADGGNLIYTDPIIAQAGSINSLTTEPALIDLHSIQPYWEWIQQNSSNHATSITSFISGVSRPPLLNDLFRVDAVNVRDLDIPEHNDLTQFEENADSSRDSS